MPRFKIICTFFAAIATLTHASAATLLAQDLFTIGDSVSVKGAAAAEISKRAVQVNAAAMGDQFTLSLPGFAKITGKPLRAKEFFNYPGLVTKSVSGEVYSESTTLTGEYNFSYTHSSATEGSFHGTIRTPEGRTFLIKEDSAAGGTSIVELDEHKQLNCAASSSLKSHRHFSKPSFPASAPSAQAATIRVLMAYTPDAVLVAGGNAQAQSALANMLSSANLAYSNSQTGVTLELAGTYPLSASSTDDFFVDLQAATDLSDGKWDELAQLREEYCADMVSVIVGGTNGEQFCGIAWIGGNASDMPLYQEQMFSIISIDSSLCNQYTFAHELGHNFGSDHDFANSGAAQSPPQSPAYAYSFGHRFFGNSAQQYRTVMAYAPGTRIPYFSSPSISFDGVATGTSQADNALSIANTSPVVAGFYGEGESCRTGDYPAPTEPTSVELTSVTKEKNGRSKVTFQVYASALGAPISGSSVQIRYDKKRAGQYTQVIKNLKTNSSGVAKYNTFLDKLKVGFYQACYSGTSTVCSGLLRKTNKRR